MPLSANEINLLRSQLQYISDDLQSLTNADVAEMKWQIRKRILTSLLSQSPTLRDQSEELVELLEHRSTVLNEQRKSSTSTNDNNNNINRETRIESEKNFRTKFMRIILSALTILQWPPALEAFSDPLDSLFHDQDIIFSSIRFLLDFGIPPRFDRYSNRDIYSDTVNSNKDLDRNLDRELDRPTSSSSHHFSPRSAYKEVNRGVDTRNDVDINNNSKEKIVLSKTGTPIKKPLSATRNNNNNGIPSLLTAVDLNNFNVGGESGSLDISKILPLPGHSPMTSRSDISFLGDDLSSIGETPRMKGARQSIQSSRSDRSGRSDVTNNNSNTNKLDRPKDYASLLKAFEISQHQNEVLSKQLHRMQQSVCVRENIESRLSTIINDLKAAIDEVVDVTTNITTKDSCDINVSAEVDDIDICKGKSDLHGGIGITKSIVKITTAKSVKSPVLAKPKVPITSNINQTSSSIIWTKLQGKISSLKSQWDESLKDSRKNVFDAITLHQSSREFTQYCNNLPSFQTNGSRNSSSNKKKNSIIHTNRPGKIRINQVLGIYPSLSLSKSVQNSEIIEIDNNGIPASIGLDLVRIHQLQRDLIEFSEHAFKWSSLIVSNNQQQSNLSSIQENQFYNEDNVDNSTLYTNRINPGKPDPFPTNISVALAQQSLEQLTMKSQALIIHLACLAPIAPLNSHYPLESSLSGLDTLINEILNTPRLSKETILRIQSASDRAKAEQMAIVRCLSANQTSLNNWAKLSTNFTPLVDQFGINMNKNLSQSIVEISKISENIKSLSISYNAAEKSRINGNNNTIISPLESLARGHMGEHVASLIVALRVNMEGINNIVNELNELKIKIQSNINIEIKSFDLAKKEISTKIIFKEDLQSNLDNINIEAENNKFKNNLKSSPYNKKKNNISNKDTTTANNNTNRGDININTNESPKEFVF